MSEQDEMEGLLRAMYPDAPQQSISDAAAVNNSVFTRALAHHRTEKAKAVAAAEAAVLERAAEHIQKCRDDGMSSNGMVHQLRALITPSAHSALQEVRKAARREVLEEVAQYHLAKIIEIDAEIAKGGFYSFEREMGGRLDRLKIRREEHQEYCDEIRALKSSPKEG